MCVIEPFTFPRGSTNSNPKVSQRRPIDRIIYYFIALGQLLLFVGFNVWIFFLVCFVDTIAKRLGEGVNLANKIVLQPAMVIVSISSWIIAATGRLGEIILRPSKYRLSRLVPPSIKNATMIKCRWTLFYQS